MVVPMSSVSEEQLLTRYMWSEVNVAVTYETDLSEIMIKDTKSKSLTVIS